MLTVNIFDKSNLNISKNYSTAVFKWTCCVDDEDMTNKVTWLKNTSDYNQIKVKFPAEKTYLTKTFTVKCTITMDTEIVSSMADFELY